MKLHSVTNFYREPPLALPTEPLVSSPSPACVFRRLFGLRPPIHARKRDPLFRNRGYPQGLASSNTLAFTSKSLDRLYFCLPLLIILFCGEKGKKCLVFSPQSRLRTAESFRFAGQTAKTSSSGRYKQALSRVQLLLLLFN